MFEDSELTGAVGPSSAEAWMDQSVFQDIHIDINILTFVFSGSFAQNAFQDAAFHLANIRLDVGVDALNNASLVAANGDGSGYAQHVGQTADQRTGTQINLVQFLVTGDVQENALEGLDFYLDNVEIDVRVATTNNADLTAVNQATSRFLEEGDGSGAELQADQRIHAKINALSFEFSGSFGGDAFREADFYFTDLWIEARVDAVNNAVLTATNQSLDGAAPGWASDQPASQLTQSEFNELNFSYGEVYDGDAFRDADFTFSGLRIEALLNPVNDIALTATHGAGLGSDAHDQPPQAEAWSVPDEPDLVWA